MREFKKSNKGWGEKPNGGDSQELVTHLLASAEQF
jgi:hypothetical protein